MPGRRTRIRRARAGVVAPAVAALVVGLLAPLTGVTGPAGAAPTDPEDPSTGPGQWSVEPSADDRWAVAWRSPTLLPLTSDRPTVVAADGAPDGLTVGPPTVLDDGRTVTALVTSPTRPDPEQLDVLLSGRALDEPEPDEGLERSRPSTWNPPKRTRLSADPGKAGGRRVVTSDYRRASVKLPGMPRKVEVRGHVVRPARGTGPLVLFLHGRHETCYRPSDGRLSGRWPCSSRERAVPSHLGYDYLQKRLASQGFVTVSISANGINAQDHLLADGGAAARASLVRRHLRMWSTSKKLPDARLRSVVLVGHSRGGEGVARASLEIPLSARFRVAGQVLLAPTAFSRQTSPYVPTVTVLPSCDGDVVDLQGQGYTDVARDVAAGDPSMKSSLLVVGANHNYFNTEWTPGKATADARDDWGSGRGPCGTASADRLTAKEQRRVGAAYVSGAVRLFSRGERRFSPLFDGSAVRLRSTRDAVVLSHMVGGGREVRRPGVDAAMTGSTGVTTRLCRGLTSWEPTAGECGQSAGGLPATPHWPLSFPPVPEQRAFEMRWDRPGGRGGLSFWNPLSLGDREQLVLRTVVDNQVGSTSVRLRVTDADGGRVLLPATSLTALPHGPAWHVGALWAQELRVEPAALSGIDRSRISRIELVATGDRGHVWVLDVAAAPRRLPAVPVRRMPFVDLGELRTPEGDDGPQVARIPYRVTGSLTSPAVFRVYGYDPWTGASREIDVTVPAGTRRGTIPWSYTGNRRRSLDAVRHDLTGYGLSGISVRDYFGRLVITDDDPMPTLSLDAVESTVVEGQEAVWRLTLSEPTDFDLTVQLVAVRPANREPVHASDLPAHWLRRWAFVPRGTDPPLHETDLTVVRVVDAGQRTVELRVPLRDDGVDEPGEAFRVRVEAPELGLRTQPSTVVVTDR
ncbi:hypothetical protein [Nocardioides caldifontis]|uniref:hypothetical protein n=1 Tax=Nocardioides caldifontis TaxID=2588938 RepID=UPI001396B59B|nr:hypothetical protein [Nocardioides caldifontis]